MLKVNVDSYQSLIVRIMCLLVSVDVAILKNHVAMVSVDRNLLVSVLALGRTVDVVVDQRLVIVLKVSVETCQGLIVRIMLLRVSVGVVILKKCVLEANVDRHLKVSV